MWTTTGKKMVTFTGGDLTVMCQARVSIKEWNKVTPLQPGLPPIWSRLPYLLLLHHPEGSDRHFWQQYRTFNDLLQKRNSHYIQCQIPKNSGGLRTLMIPDPTLRFHQQFILRDILCHIPVSPYACAYHKGRGLRDLARPHIGHETLIHLDLADFFSHVTEQMVYEALLKETGYPKSVAGFLSRLCCYRGYLPQGACTSPALSNICFKACDTALAALAQKHNMVYTRYSDDLYFSGNGVDAGAVIRDVKTLVSSYGFSIRNDKTKVLGKHHCQKVTSLVVNEKLQVSRDYRRKLRQEIYYLKKFGWRADAALEAEYYAHYLYQLRGRISFVLYADPENEEFRNAAEYIDILLANYQSCPRYFF